MNGFLYQERFTDDQDWYGGHHRNQCPIETTYISIYVPCASKAELLWIQKEVPWRHATDQEIDRATRYCSTEEEEEIDMTRHNARFKYTHTEL